MSGTPAPSGPDATRDDRLRSLFRYVNRVMVVLWRLGLGRWADTWPRGSGRILVLGHTGRRSGMRRWTPLNYDEVDGEIYCTAGFGAGSDWYRNVTADPRVELWLPDRRTSATVDDVSDDPRRVELLRGVLLASGFAAPAAGLDPRHLDDDELAAATDHYRLLRLQPTVGPVDLPAHPRPGDLAAWWVVAIAVVLVALGRRHRR
jgi:deazaflavin-dependent oxidoreductase (nitroreductase family)